MTKQEMLDQVYHIYQFPPKTEIEADRNFVWKLLQAGCHPYYILAATESLSETAHTNDVYSDTDREKAPHWIRHVVMKEYVVNPRWKRKEYKEDYQYCTCSECDEVATGGECFGDNETPYCPWCGAELCGTTEVRHEYED